MDSARAVLSRLRRPGRVWVDLLVLLALFAALNFLTNAGSPGWFAIQPNPYLLIPVLIGGRYGSAAGLYGASACVVWLAVCESIGSGLLDPELFLKEESVLLFAFFVFGLASGEVQGFFRRKAAEMELRLAHSTERLAHLDRDIRRISAINRELQERLLVNDNRTFAIDVEIRSLYECRTDELWEKALGILARTEQVGCAALYVPSDNAAVVPRRIASIGGDDRLTERLDPGDYPLVSEALRRGEMLVLPEWLEIGSDGSSEPFLLAKPLIASDGRWCALLIVSRMPLLHFDKQTLGRIDLMMDWIGEIVDLRMGGGSDYQAIEGVENKKLLSETHFRRMLELSMAAWRDLRVPSGLVLLCLKTDGGDSGQFLKRINSRVRTGDFLHSLENARANAVILLPFTPERGTEVFMESCRRILGRDYAENGYTMDSLAVGAFENLPTLWAEIERTVREANS